MRYNAIIINCFFGHYHDSFNWQQLWGAVGAHRSDIWVGFESKSGITLDGAKILQVILCFSSPLVRLSIYNTIYLRSTLLGTFSCFRSSKKMSVCSGYLCLILRLVWWSETCKCWQICQKNLQKQEETVTSSVCCIPVDQKPELCMSLTPATQSALAESSYSSYLGHGYLMFMVMVGQWLALSSHSISGTSHPDTKHSQCKPKLSILRDKKTTSALIYILCLPANS